MFALLLAAQLASGPEPAVVMSDRLFASQRNCGLWEAQPVNRRAPRPRIQSLGELPPADMELAVLRLGPDGCSKAVVVRRNVQFDGRAPAPRK